MIGAEHAAELTQQLLAYAGKEQRQSKIIDLNRIVVENADLMEAAVSNRIDLQFALSDGMRVCMAIAARSNRCS